MWLVFYKDEKETEEAGLDFMKWVARRWLSKGVAKALHATWNFRYCEVVFEEAHPDGGFLYQAYGISDEKNEGVAYKEVRTSGQFERMEREGRIVAYHLLFTPDQAEKLQMRTRRRGSIYGIARRWYEQNLHRRHVAQGMWRYVHCALCAAPKDSEPMHTAEFCSYSLQLTQKVGGVNSSKPFFPKRYTVDTLEEAVREKESPARSLEDTTQFLERMREKGC